MLSYDLILILFPLAYPLLTFDISPRMTRLLFTYGQTRDSERTYLDHRLFACYLGYESTSVLVRYTL